MNKSHKSIWNVALGAWVAVSELATARGKSSKSGAAIAALSALALAVPLTVDAQTVTLTGTNGITNPVTSPTWTTGAMQIGSGSGATGALTVSGGGQIVSSSTFEAAIGYDGGTGTATITGAGSSWQSTAGFGNWRIGYTLGTGLATTGTLNILNGATVTGLSAPGGTGFAVVGQGTNGTGFANVSGTGSTWNVANGLLIGNSQESLAGAAANGTVTVSNGGVINTPAVDLAYINAAGQSAAVGTLNIGAAPGSAAVAPGTVNAAAVTMGSGGPATNSASVSTLNFNHTSTDGSYVFAPAISSSTVGTATINQIAGYTTLTGDSSGFNGTTNVTGGTLGVQGKLGSAASSLNVNNGTFAVSSGGVVNSSTTTIGGPAGSNGLATVDGAGSSLTTQGNLAVGLDGTGTLAITNGGKVSALGTVPSSFVGVGYGAGTGTVTIDGAGSSLTSVNGYFVGGGSSATGGSGSVTVSNGASLVANNNSFVAFSIPGNSGSGTVTVTGAGSSFTQTGQLRLGYGNGGTEVGTLNVLNGATTTTTDFAAVGLGTGGVGVVNVSGPGSTLNVATTTNTSGAGLIIGIGFNSGAGANDSGTVTVSNGGVINAPVVNLGADGGQASSGTLNIGAAAGSPAASPGTLNTPSLAFNSALGGTGALSSGTLNFNHTSTDGSYVFAPAISSSTVGTATINQIAGYTTLTGDSSGFNGTTHETGGTLGVTGKLGSAASTLNVDNGTFAVYGGGVVNSATTTIGAPAGSNGHVTVDGTGSSLTAGTSVTVGGAGTGTLAITNGATATFPNGTLLPTGSMVIGSASGSNGSVTVDGTGSHIQAGDIMAGYLAGSTGSLAISNGATVDASRLRLGGVNGGTTGGSGSLAVTGAGSVLNVSSAGTFIGGSDGATGTALVSNGGQVNNAITFLGFNGASGSITVTDPGSAWNDSREWRVGYSDTATRSVGTVNIQNGATASVLGAFAVIGLGNGTGSLSVSGAGSKFTSASPTYLGYGIGGDPGSAIGTMTIANGGVVQAPSVNLGYSTASASGTINIGAAAGNAPVAPGTLNAPTVAFGVGTGVVNFNHTSTDGSYIFAPVLSSSTGSATINQLAGNTNLTGNSSNFGGTTNVTGGTLRVNGTLGNAASTVAVSNGGTLGGAGTIGGNVGITNGVLSPGNGGAGTLTIAGNLSLGAASQLNYELGAANTVGGALNDLTVVGGNLTLAGTLNVTQSAGGTYGAGIYRLINYTGSLTNNGLALGNMPAGSVNYVQTSVANQVNLVNSNGLTLNFWDGDAGVKNDGVIAGGNGTWLAGPTGTDRWTQADGKINAPYQNPSFAVFEGAPGTVTVDNSLGQVAVSGMQFATSGYRIQGGPVSLTAGTDAIRVGDGTSAGTSTTATIASALFGAGRLDKVDVGTLVLSGANTYTGGTQVSGGTLQLGEGGTTGSIVGDVTDNAVFAFNRSDANTFAGVISGTGAVQQIGSGNTTLAGVNTYSGGTTISAGTLTGSATSFGSGAIADNAALVINQPADASMANAINGSGSLVKTGAGALNYTGSGTLSGPTTVAAGTLAVNGSLASSAVTVASGATLAGTGTVGATALQAGATVAPGNSGIGALNVNGNFVQAAGATYQVQVDSSTKNTSDRINVAGTATLASGSVLNVTRTGASPYTLDSKYTVLSATGGVSGTYSLTGDTRTAFVQLGDTYDANNVYLTATQVRSFASAGLTPNQIATAGGLGTLGTSSLLRNAVAFLPNDIAARAAFDQLSGEQHASVQTALMEDSRFVREAANDRLLGAFCSPGASALATTQSSTPGTGDCTPTRENVAWARVFASTGSFEGDGNAQTVKRDIGGFFLGADTSLDGGWRVGGLGGYSRASLNGNSGSGKTDDYHLGVYAGNEWDGTSVRLGAAYTWHKLDLQRGVSFSGFADSLSSKYDGSTAQIFGEAGHRFDVARGVAIEPFAGLAYVSVKTDGFTERGGLAALSAGGATFDSTFSTLGARMSAQLDEKTTLRGMLGWRHAFGNTVPQSTNAFFGSLPFTVSGVPLAKNVVVIEAGVETELRPNLKLSASYSGQFGSKLHDNGVKVSLAYKF